MSVTHRSPIQKAVLTIGVAAAAPLLLLLTGAHAPKHDVEDRAPKHVVEERVTALENEVAALQSQLASLQANHALDLGPYVSVDPDTINGLAGPHVIFTGANVHVRSGSGSTTGVPNGLGNLLVGYNEEPFLPLAAGDRGGMHNLITGSHHRYPAYGGFVAGWDNTIIGNFSTVSGGVGNTAGGPIGASISGGFRNRTFDSYAHVSGGQDNRATYEGGSVSGGQNNTASGHNSSVSGGSGNEAFGDADSVSSGSGNTARGGFSSVSGGSGNTASGRWSSVSGGEHNTASGLFSSVSGGNSRSTVNQDNWAAGGLSQSN